MDYDYEKYPDEEYFRPKLQDILGDIYNISPKLVCKAPIMKDLKEATDLILPNGITVGCRVRNFGAFKWFEHQLLLRRQLPSGVKTELEKILEGYCDIYLYAFCDRDAKEVISWVLYSMDVFRREVTYYIEYLRYEDVRINGFPGGRAFSIKEFPPEFVINYYNHETAVQVQLGRWYVRRK